jgi:serine/threonine-protein kinase RsbW
MTEPPPLVRLTLPSKSENVAVVRHALAGLAEALGMAEDRIGDLKTIVTEACMNVVTHAYDGGEGPLEVVAQPDSTDLLIVVRDYGHGIRPRPAVDEPSLRLGMPLIAALSSSFEIRGAHGQGTEVRARVPIHANGNAADQPVEDIEQPEATLLSVEAGDMVAPIVSRVISMLASRADLTVDRLSDAILLGDAISANAGSDFPDGRVQIGIGDSAGAIEVRIGPLRDGAAKRLLKAMEVPAVGASLESLADDVTVESDDGTESVVLRIGER